MLFLGWVAIILCFTEGLVFGRDIATRKDENEEQSCFQEDAYMREYGACMTLLWARSQGEAEMKCIAMGGHLISIHSDAQIQAIEDFLVAKKIRRNRPLWIGGRFNRDTYTWYWLDGTKWDYTSWSSGNPNNWGGDEFCLEVIYEGISKFNDVSCKSLAPPIKRAICQYTRRA